MSTRWTVRTIAVLIAVIACAPSLFGQTKTPSSGVGLAASIQEGQFDIMVPIWLSERFTIAPAIGIVWAEDAGSDIRIGIAPRYYLRKEALSPYVGLRLGALMNSPSNGSSTTDILIGGAFGGEYFFSEYFSLGVEAQANMVISDSKSARFGNPGKMNLNTAAAVIAGVYF
jgi:hypothetical protein